MRTLGDLAHDHMTAIADAMSPNFPDVRVDMWGIRVRRAGQCDIYLMMMLGGNWRLLEVIPHPTRPEPEAASNPRGWCYTGPHAFMHAIAAALRWDGNPDTEPSGWAKAVHDGRRHGEPKAGLPQL